GHPGPLLPGRLGGADVEPAVDLAGIGGDDLDRPVLRQRQSDRGLSYRRGPHQHRDPTGGQIAAPAPRVAAARWSSARARRAAAARWRTAAAAIRASRAGRAARPPSPRLGRRTWPRTAR